MEDFKKEAIPENEFEAQWVGSILIERGIPGLKYPWNLFIQNFGMQLQTHTASMAAPRADVS